ncbi:LytR/AlgR family response regulator transcription factor [Niastella sp. OAS944]|uniref:LytR/AlgR family response regulator transcription factor n=1 Tax=Niastella sp. OAS944 TaxID=2664089 RepID=UPI0034738D37|nr:DNA-binding LytR/AlgR family response regulator [Chitinophagaceae bacterium OAS944]
MMKCIAIDDEPFALQLLKDYISHVPYLELVALCEDVFEANKVLQQQDIDLVFTDIQMPRLTGLQFIQSLTERPMFILITAYEKFALEGFNLNVVDYLLKPVELSRFMLACNKAYELFQLKKAAKQSTDTGPPYFFVSAEYRQVKVIYKDITYIEGLKDYIKINLLAPAKPLLVRMSMKSIEEELPSSQFIRIHKSYIVSVDSITSVRKSSVFIDQLELPVGETYQGVIEQLTKRKS